MNIFFDISVPFKIYNTRYLIYSASAITEAASETASETASDTASDTASETASDFEKILQLTKEITKKNNSKLYFVYLPDYNRYKINYDNPDYNLVKNIVSKLNIPFIDIHKEVFEKEQNPLKLFPFELFGHYNVEGYRKVAETIYKFTKD